MRIKNQPATAVAPVRCLAPDLRRIWDVEADMSYDIECYRSKKQLITLRTLAGVGKIQLLGRPPILLTANSLITVEQPAIERYRCLEGHWRFWWFEYMPSEPLPIACHVVFPVVRHPSESVQVEEIFVKMQHQSEAERRIAAASLQRGDCSECNGTHEFLLYAKDRILPEFRA